MKKITILILTSVAMAAGCKRFTDINQNQNQPTAAPTNLLLSAALASSGNSLGTDFFDMARWMGYWSRSGNYIATIPTEQYTITPAFEDGSWQDLYATSAKYANMQNEAFASSGTQAFYIGVAKTMEALHLSNLVDGFGNIPYSQAFNISKYVTPKFDDAATVYSSLITQLDSAVYYFNQANTFYNSPSGSTQATTDNKFDIMFGRSGGNSASARMADWIAFANTIKLKLLNTASQVSAFSSIAVAEATKANGQFLTPGLIASVNPGYSNASTTQLSPFYSAFVTAAGAPTGNYQFYRGNNYAIGFYELTNDVVRASAVYAQAAVGGIHGNYDGDPSSNPNPYTSGLGPAVLVSPGQDQVIMSDFEGLFIQAEAAARGYIPGGTVTANTLLKEAIEQNFIYLGSTMAAADAYYTANATNPNVTIAGALANPVAPGSDLDKTPGMQAILTQKWIALNEINWFQAYTDFRRSGFPIYNLNGSGFFGPSYAQSHVQHTGQLGAGAYIPYRFLYPQSEFDTNEANIPSLAQSFYTPIFWDTREK